LVQTFVKEFLLYIIKYFKTQAVKIKISAVFNKKMPLILAGLFLGFSLIVDAAGSNKKPLWAVFCFLCLETAGSFGSLVSPAFFAVDRSICGWFKRKLDDFLAAFRTFPAAFYHRARSKVSARAVIVISVSK
jgi:hypothetical protein